ncbi:TPA: LacI family DNA-binding transcriptional regulator, partial [Yersinia enterocolitica]
MFSIEVTLVNPQSRRITRSDVAREAGTSVAVVSYVINNGPRPVAPATKQRVLDAIKKTGYR